MTEEPDLYAAIREHHASIQQEFDLINNDDIESLSKAVKREFSSKLLHFTKTIIDLTEPGNSESVRLSAAKYGISFVLGTNPSTANKEDSFAVLLEQLSINDPSDPEE